MIGNKDREAGDYTVRTKNGYEYTHQEHDHHQECSFGDQFVHGYINFIFIKIVTIYSVSYCIMSCCAMCSLSLIYKLHDSTKELNILQVQYPSQAPYVSIVVIN